MTTLIIARHGNTFEAGETPTRVGARTDLPLTEKGLDQGKAIGKYLLENNMVPDVVYTSLLKRTIQTAEAAIKETGIRQPVYPLDIFNEIDYGPDENKSEEEVIARIGAQAIKDWDNDAVAPEGWEVNPEEIIQNWKGFAEKIVTHDDGQEFKETIMVVTSNGVARFAPYITGDFEAFAKEHKIKISTGAICIFEFEDGKWVVKGWNIKP
jgi:2,3-bisphosphoglycerate-dependent phosphoglycerate mutase